jgi:hypothetical protein
MRTLRAVLVWLVALAVLLAGPASSLAECLRCPPDCPMHARRASVEPAHGDEPAAVAARAHGGHDVHAAHVQPGGGRAEHTGAEGDCHRRQPAKSTRPDDGPCIGGLCGHMDASLARALPEAVLAVPRSLAPPLVSVPALLAVPLSLTRLGEEPPTDPPRPLA